MCVCGGGGGKALGGEVAVSGGLECVCVWKRGKKGGGGLYDVQFLKDIY